MKRYIFIGILIALLESIMGMKPFNKNQNYAKNDTTTASSNTDEKDKDKEEENSSDVSEDEHNMLSRPATNNTFPYGIKGKK